MKTFEEFTFKGLINKARAVKAKDPFIPEEEPYNSMFVGTGRILKLGLFGKLGRLDALKNFIKEGQWYNIKFGFQQGNGKINKIIKIDQTYCNNNSILDNPDNFKIYYYYEFKDGEEVRDAWAHPHILVIDVSKDYCDSITIEHLETIEYRKNMEIFRKLKIKKHDNILVSKFSRSNGGVEIDPMNNIFKVTGIDKGFYWGMRNHISGYKIYAKDVIKNLGPSIINRDIDPYGEEDWNLR